MNFFCQCLIVGEDVLWLKVKLIWNQCSLFFLGVFAGRVNIELQLGKGISGASFVDALLRRQWGSRVDRSFGAGLNRARREVSGQVVCSALR